VLLLAFLLLLFLALDRQRVIPERDLDVLLVHAGQLDVEMEGLVILGHIELRHDLAAAHRLERHRRPSAAPHLFEHAIDVSMQHLDLTTQAPKRPLFASPRDKTTAPTPRDDVSSCHGYLLWSVCPLKSAGDEAPARNHVPLDQ